MPSPGRPPHAIHVATDVVIPGALTVDVFRHDLMSQQGKVTCWSLVSQGLQRVGQKEICFSIKMEPDEGDVDYPRSLHALYAFIHDGATASRVVNVGGLTELTAGASLLGRADFTGVAYSLPQFFEGIPSAAAALTGLVLTTGEYDVVRRFGLVRVMALLGDEVRYFPTAPWADRQRRELISPADMEASVLSKVPCVIPSDTVAYFRRRFPDPPAANPPGSGHLLSTAGLDVVLEMAPPAWATLSAALSSLPPAYPIAVIASPDPVADGCLVWRRGTDGIRGISAPGSTDSRVAGNHVIFIPAQSANSVQIVEDGFAVKLTTEAWSAFREALGNQSASWTAPDCHPIGFRFRRAGAAEAAFPEEVFHNPVDGVAYAASGGWRRYQPTVPVVNDQADCRVKTDHIRLLTEQARIPERTTTKELAAFIGVVERLANEHLATSASSFRLLIQFTCMPKGHSVKMATQGDAPVDLLQALLSALEQADPVAVTQDDVSFQIEMIVGSAPESASVN